MKRIQVSWPWSYRGMLWSNSRHGSMVGRLTLSGSKALRRFPIDQRTNYRDGKLTKILRLRHYVTYLPPAMHDIFLPPSHIRTRAGRTRSSPFHLCSIQSLLNSKVSFHPYPLVNPNYLIEAREVQTSHCK